MITKSVRQVRMARFMLTHALHVDKVGKCDQRTLWSMLHKDAKGVQLARRNGRYIELTDDGIKVAREYGGAELATREKLGDPSERVQALLHVGRVFQLKKAS